MLIDTHAHLDYPEFSDLDSVLDRAEKAGVREVITIGIDLPSSKKAVELAKSRSRIYAVVGIHPHDSFHMTKEDIDRLRTLAREDSVVAIGEIGLDFFRDHQPHDIQRACLRQQLELATDLEIPAVFHIRDAYDEFLEIIKDYAAQLPGGVMHCFSGDWQIACKCLDMGFYLSIPGTVTFPKAATIQDVVRKAPLDRLILETDAPYLTPVPYRGKVNEPSYVLHTARKVAELRGVPFDEIAARTTENAHRVFRIKTVEGSAGGLR